MDFDKRAAAWLTSYIMTNKYLRPAAELVDLESVPFATKCIVAFGSLILGEHAEPLKEILEALHQSQALEPVLGEMEAALAEPEARQAQDEQARVDQQAKDEQARVDQQAKDEQARIDQQAKDEHTKEDAELATAVIEAETGILHKQISAEGEKSAAETYALKKVFEREQQELTGKLDGMARNYFDKHPDLSEDQRRDATETFKGIKEEALGELRGQQETRLGELTRAQQDRYEDLEERRKQLDGTRSDR
jgi:hypothetical protein